jgi:hypothetical protein
MLKPDVRKQIECRVVSPPGDAEPSPLLERGEPVTVVILDNLRIGRAVVVVERRGVRTLAVERLRKQALRNAIGVPGGALRVEFQRLAA